MIANAKRMGNLAPQFFSALNEEIAALKESGKEVLRLDIGSPDLPPAPHIISALSDAARRPDIHGYQSHRGPLALRAAWAAMYQRVHQVELDPDEEIIPLLGTKEGIFHLTMAMINPGDVVLIPDPGYLTYTQSALFAGGELYFMPLRDDRNFLPDFEAIPADIVRRAKLIWLNYPNNPTTATCSREFFMEAVEFAQENSLLLCHDAAYTQVTFDGSPALSILEIPNAKEVSLEFNSLSKTYNMAGWRTGAAAGNPQALRALFTLKTHIDSGHFYPVWMAAIAAMNGDQEWLRARNDVYRQRRDRILTNLHKLGLMALEPQATIYIWCPVPKGWTSAKFAGSLLREAYVSVTPGTVFGSNGEGYVRISLTSPDEKIDESMQRLSDWMTKWA